MTNPQLYACLTYRDCAAAFGFLHALGFTDRLIVRDPADPTQVVHAQLAWRDNGGIMVGSVREDDPRGFASRPGQAAINIVVGSDADVDATLARAVAAGATQLDEVHSPPHGGRTVAVHDAEGNLWNIDSYPGE